MSLILKDKNFESIFNFKKVTPEETVKVIRNLNIKVARGQTFQLKLSN